MVVRKSLFLLVFSSGPKNLSAQDKLRPLMEKWVGDKDLPMAMTLVARKGKVVYWQVQPCNDPI
jgi:hypothetical protein